MVNPSGTPINAARQGPGPTHGADLRDRSLRSLLISVSPVYGRQQAYTSPQSSKNAALSHSKPAR